MELKYTKWNNNWDYNHSRLDLTPFIKRLDKKVFFKYRLDLKIIPLLRLMFNKPLDYEKEFKKLQRQMVDVSQINPNKYYRDFRKLTH